MRGLPEDKTVSLTYCQCSRGLVEKTWELILGRPVQVEILESAISGATECKFVIHLQSGDFEVVRSAASPETAEVFL